MRKRKFSVAEENLTVTKRRATIIYDWFLSRRNVENMIYNFMWKAITATSYNDKHATWRIVKENDAIG